MAASQVTNQRGGVLRRVVEDSDGDERRKRVGQPAAEDEVEAGLLDARVKVRGPVPGVCGGDVHHGLSVVRGGVAHVVLKLAAPVNEAEAEFADGVAQAVSHVL